jgi:hypothetical protein
VVDEAATVEHNGVDSRSFGTLANNLSNRACFDALGCVRAGPIEHILLQVTGRY